MPAKMRLRRLFQKLKVAIGFENEENYWKTLRQFSLITLMNTKLSALLLLKWSLQFGASIELLIPSICLIVVGILVTIKLRREKNLHGKLLKIAILSGLLVTNVLILQVYNIFIYAKGITLQREEMNLELLEGILTLGISLVFSIQFTWSRVILIFNTQMYWIIKFSINPLNFDFGLFFKESKGSLFLFAIFIWELQKANSSKNIKFQKLSLLKQILEICTPGPVILLRSKISTGINFTSTSLKRVFANKSAFDFLSQVQFDGGESSFIDCLKSIIDDRNSNQSLIMRLFSEIKLSKSVSGKGRLDIIKDIRNTQKIKQQNANFEVELKLLESRLKKGDENHFLLLINNIDRTHNYANASLQDKFVIDNETLTSFMHNLRSPLNVVKGIIYSCFKMIDKGDRLRKLMKIALNSSRILEYNIYDLLDFFNFSCKKDTGDLKITSVNIKKLLDIIKSKLKLEAEEREINLLFKSDLPDNVCVLSDINRLERVLINLVMISMRTASKGEVQLIVKEETNNQIYKSLPWTIDEDLTLKHHTSFQQNYVERSNKFYSSVIIIIQDNGIPKEKMDIIDRNYVSSSLNLGRLFSLHIEELVRAPVVNNQVQGRFSILIEKVHDNDFFLESAIHKDVESDHIKTLKNFPSLSKSPFITQRLRVLLVDDEPFNILVLKLYFDSFKIFDYESACNGLEAFNKFMDSNLLNNQNSESQRKSFDLIIMDYNMPILNGTQSCSLIKEAIKNGSAHPVFIIGLTANTGRKIEEECKRAGMESLLFKPVENYSLKRKIEEIMNIKF